MSKPLFIAIADVHIHPHKHGGTYDDDGRQSRVMLTVDALREVFTAARALKVGVIILGDLLHDKYAVPVDVIGPMLELQVEFSDVHTQLLVGNHERPDRYTDVNILGWLARGNWSVISSVQSGQPPQPAESTTDLYYLPWYSDFTKPCADLRECLIKGSASRPERPRILLGHGCIHGSLSDSQFRLTNPNLTEDLLCATSYNLVLFGDIHQQQQLSANTHYVGALTPQNFGERNNPTGYTIVYEDLTMKRVPVTSGPKFEYSETLDVPAVESGDKQQTFVKPSPAAIAANIVATHPGVSIKMDTTNLDAMVEAYVVAHPPSDPRVTLPNVLARLKTLLPKDAS